jgi:hypothetical protein
MVSPDEAATDAGESCFGGIAWSMAGIGSHRESACLFFRPAHVVRGLIRR